MSEHKFEIGKNSEYIKKEETNALTDEKLNKFYAKQRKVAWK